uniref:Uncharacterized protein n=1 Tax=Lepeophtheirus salmonis TaxID=72036 RepID=A0A0K2V8N2_LEPSM
MIANSLYGSYGSKKIYTFKFFNNILQAFVEYPLVTSLHEFVSLNVEREMLAT